MKVLTNVFTAEFTKDECNIICDALTHEIHRINEAIAKVEQGTSVYEGMWEKREALRELRRPFADITGTQFSGIDY